MNYSQYTEQHQQLTDQLEVASKEFEDLRKTYDDSASPEERSNLEPALKDSMNRVEVARADLSALESQEPEQEIEAEAFEVDGFEVASEVSGLAEKFSNFKETIAAISMLGNVHATVLPLEPAWEQSPSIQSEQPAEQSQDLGKDLEDPVRSPREQKEAIEEQRDQTRESVQSYDDAHENANVRSGEDILVENEPGLPHSQNEMEAEVVQNQAYTSPDYDTVMSERTEEIHAGIAQGKGFGNAVNDANESLYSKVAGEPYNGSTEDLSHSVAEKIEASYGIECKQAFEQSNPSQLEQQQQQEQEQDLTH